MRRENWFFLVFLVRLDKSTVLNDTITAQVRYSFSSSVGFSCGSRIVSNTAFNNAAMSLNRKLWKYIETGGETSARLVIVNCDGNEKARAFRALPSRRLDRRKCFAPRENRQERCHDGKRTKTSRPRPPTGIQQKTPLNKPLPNTDFAIRLVQAHIAVS